LSAEGDGTRLKVVESGFRELGWPEDDQQKHADNHRAGCEQELDELSEYLRRPAPTSGER
jgi:hypothetical protein